LAAHEATIRDAGEANECPGERLPTIVIQPSSGWAALRLGEVWRYRELLYFLTWRDLKLRYKQTLIGATWAVIQPFMTMVVFAVIFGRLVGVPSDGLPYPVFAYTALVPWTFFATSMTQAGMSLVRDSNLISKIYFPRLVMPIASVLSGVVDFGVAFVVLLGLMAWYGIVPGVAMLTIPLFLLLALMSALGISLWLAALNVKYRDIRYTVPFLTQFWLYATPVAYPSSLIPERWRLLYGLNPMAGVIEGFRWALLGTVNPPGAMIAVSSTIVVVVFVGGLFFFRRMEREFADVV
jgi:lipopolysaccharide transport system permease protein